MAPIATKKKKVKYTLSDLKTLGHQLLTSRVHINNLPLLLTFVSPTSHPQYVLESLLSLQSFFTPILADLPPSSTSKSSIRHGSNHDPEFIYRTWLRSKFDELVKLLIDVVVSPEPEDTLKEVALDSIMEFVKVGNGGRFHSAIYHKLLHNIVYCPTPTSVLVDLLTSKYFKYIDVRYFAYISLEKFARTLEAKFITDADGNGQSLLSSSMEHVTQNIYYVISHLPSLEGWDEISDFDMWSRSGLFSKESDLKQLSEDVKAEDNQLKMKKKNNDISSAVHNIAKKMKLKFTKAWTSYLRLPLPLGVYKEVLVNLHQAVIPYFSNPILLCDFLTRSYDIGGVVSVMALSSLYLLMTQYGLEYPNFYEKLYALLVPSIFMAKHRAKFFQLLDSCLKSPLLPAYLAASFAKKLSRLSLSVSPSGALVIVALIHNLLRRHPSINCLVHREDGDEHGNDDPETEKVMVDTVNISGTSRDIESWKSCIDLFNNNETNPMKSSAMRSSLWEIDTLRHHYCPPVSRFVLSLENDLTIRAKTTEIAVKDFCSGSYATIFGEEMKRRVKQVPLAFYKATPTSLFSESEFAGWTFKYEDSLEIIGGSKEVTRNVCDHDNGSAKRQRIDSN